MKIPYGKQNIIKKDIDAVVDVLKSEFITQGSKVSEFEALFAYYVGAKYSVAVSSGTAALHLANIAVGTKTGNKVLTSPISFVATSNSVLYCGGEVDFVDIDPHTFLIDLNKLEEKLRRNRKSVYSGIIPVDFAGLPVNVENLRYIANKYNLWIIEDACHAPGGYFFDSKGIKQYCGNGVYSDLQIFSFHPVKHIAAGEGGMITTNNKRLYEQIVRLRNHGIIRNSHNWAKNIEGWYYEMQELGYNYRLSDINCALAVSQLNRAGDGIKKRNEIAKKYNEAFVDMEQIEVPYVPGFSYHAWHLYVIQVKDRKNLYDYLKGKGVFTQVHYIPIHLQPYYKRLGWKYGDFPVAEGYYRKALSLPMYPSLTVKEQEYVIEKVLEFYSSK